MPHRFVDGVDDLSANWHIVRGEPTPHSFVLQVGVEALGERLVLS
jgi:hypothetical protein